MPVSGREFCRLLKKDGWEFRRIRGSHHIYAKDEETIAVPVHGNKSLKKGILYGLAKDAGLKVR